LIGNCFTVVCSSHLSTRFLFTAGIGRASATCYKQSQSRVNLFMTARLDVTPKTTEYSRIVRTGKSKAEVTNNKETAFEVLYYWS